MKEELNNEMDLLLRNFGRTVNAGFEIDGAEQQHMDADELNAYAEKVLPPAAQVRYMKHIADCASCRTQVAELSVAAGVIVEKKAAAVAPVVAPSAVKVFLSSLFSPMVLRYSVPAMTLVIVATVGFLVFKRSNDSQNLAMQKSPAVAQNEQAKPSGPPAGGDYDSHLADKADTANKTEPASNKSGENQPEATKEATEPADDKRQSKDAKADQPVTATDQVSAAPAAAASGNAAAAPPPEPKPTAVVQQEPVARRAGSSVAPAETVSVAKSNEREEDREKKTPVKETKAIGGFAGVTSSPAKAKSEAARGRGDASRDAEEKQREQADKDTPETKSVGGRRFRREGSTWIDVAYTSQATTNVSRSSEQYRALIADEPGIKTIADQLAGEVIVVWKGRAYKIK